VEGIGTKGSNVPTRQHPVHKTRVRRLLDWPWSKVSLLKFIYLEYAVYVTDIPTVHVHPCLHHEINVCPSLTLPKPRRPGIAGGCPRFSAIGPAGAPVDTRKGGEIQFLLSICMILSLPIRCPLVSLGGKGR
jgi:hypothetical protein